MTDQGGDPTRTDTPAVGGPDDPTVVGAPPVGPEPVTGTGGAEGPPPGSPPPPWGPDGERPDRRPWIIAALLGLIALVAILLLLLGGDDDDDSPGTTTTTTTESTTTTEPTTTTTETTTTTTEAPTTSAAPPVTADPAQCTELGGSTDPEPVAQAVFIAWTRGDTACADPLMTDDAMDELFSRDGSSASDVFQGCTEVDEPDIHWDCAFTYPGGSTHYLLQDSAIDGWQVYDIEQVAD